MIPLWVPDEHRPVRVDVCAVALYFCFGQAFLSMSQFLLPGKGMLALCCSILKDFH